jgi:8-oxo-dGTP pyrophosphatase MutT (NUDIX family)
MLCVREQLRAGMTQPARALKDDTFQLAAVAAILTEDDALVFMRRAIQDRDPWSGHLSFPGGRREPQDGSDRHTAIRETEEEIGIDLHKADYVGRLNDLRTLNPLPTMLIRPHLFFHNGPLNPVLNDEAVSLHSLSVQALLNGDGRGTMKHPWRGIARDFPCVRFDGVCLWGLTLHMVDDILFRIDGKRRGLLDASEWER